MENKNKEDKDTREKLGDQRIFMLLYMIVVLTKDELPFF